MKTVVIGIIIIILITGFALFKAASDYDDPFEYDNSFEKEGKQNDGK